MEQEKTVIDENWNLDSAAYELLANFIVKRFVAHDEAEDDAKAV